MENRKLPALFAIVGVVVAVGLFLLLKDDTADEASERAAVESPAASSGAGDGDESTKADKPDKPEKPLEPKLPRLEIKAGEPVGGVQEFGFDAGEEIRIEVVTDAPDELHFHGYEQYVDITPGKANEIVVPNADIEGIFELESHSTGVLLAEISVNPS